MDFKARNPDFSWWPPEALPGFERFVFPYNGPNMLSISEYHAPDDTTQFLSLFGYMTEDEKYTISYLIEAPTDCPMRRAFEFGDIDWVEYWYHKDWMVELRYDFEGGTGASARYIHPWAMDAKTKKYIQDHNDQSPMQRVLDALEFAIRSAQAWGEPIEPCQEALDEFRRKYPMIVTPNTKQSKAA